MALAHDTKLLILDEATGMDVSGREEVIEMLEDYISEGMAYSFHLIFPKI